MRESIFSFGLLVAGLCSQVVAQCPANPAESLETLTTNANDPTAILAQLKVEEDYTPDEYVRRSDVVYGAVAWRQQLYSGNTAVRIIGFKMI